MSLVLVRNNGDPGGNVGGASGEQMDYFSRFPQRLLQRRRRHCSLTLTGRNASRIPDRERGVQTRPRTRPARFQFLVLHEQV